MCEKNVRICTNIKRTVVGQAVHSVASSGVPPPMASAFMSRLRIETICPTRWCPRDNRLRGKPGVLSTLLRERSFGRLQTLPQAPLTGARSVSQTGSCMPALIRGRCTLSMRPPETFSGISRVGAQFWMAHRSWTARSIGDPVTRKSMEPETTKCSPLLWPASIRTTEVSESDCLHLTHCPTSTNIGSDLKTEWTFADVGR
jgi:hypothetical protein